MTAKELHEKAGRLLAQARGLLETAESEGRNLTSEEETRYDELQGESDRLYALSTKLTKQEESERRQAEVEDEERRRRDARREAQDPEAIERRHEAAFDSWLRLGTGGLTVEERSILNRNAAQLPPEARALSVGTPSAGGYQVPQGFQRELDKALLAFGGMREAGRVLNTSDGADLPWPNVNDTGNKGAILAENNQVTEQDVTYGSVTLQAFMYTSKMVRVSLQLMQDSAFDVGAHLRDLLAERIARITNEHFTTGDGSSKPRGVVTAAANSSVTFTANAITWDKLVDIEHAVDPAYRMGARWMFSDDSLKMIKKVKTYDGSTAVPEFAWQPGLAVGAPPTILGYPYTINQDMAGPGTSTNKAVLFGNFQKYIIRDARPLALLQLRERYADYLQVGFLAFSRHDGDLIDAGTNPIKYAAVA